MTTTFHAAAQTSKVFIDNDKVKVTEYISRPGEDVCGKGLHKHPDHLTILLTDAKVKATNSRGESRIEIFNAGKHLCTVNANRKQQNFPGESVFWAKGEEHEVTNVSGKPLRFYIVETK
ncbi:MAG: hypothetical protein QM768_02380 [Agriterribacter sp.]